jgi:beta-N-acetylhexosaminidase
MKIPFKIFFCILLLLTFLFLPQIIKDESIYEIKDDIRIVKLPPLEERTLTQMTLEQKVGQLLMFGLNGLEITEDTKDLIKTRYIGGFLLLGKNISDEKQLKNLTTQLQNESEIPLLISIDQEGGVVSRIKWDKDLSISQKNMDKLEDIYSLSVKKSKILKDLGINVNLAPVVEYITDKNSFLYQRAFTGTKEEVSKKAYSAIKGYSDSNMISVAKHYPGHSNLSQDSHFSLPKVDISPDQWDKYISPFSYLINNGIVDVIMVGHILYPNIDSKPSAISNTIINKKLREDLNYQGVVITDDMQMSSIGKYGEDCNIAKEALKAGNDILLYSMYSPKPNLQRDIYDCILNAVNSNEIPLEEINQKVLRILKLKIKYGLIDRSILQPQE